LPSWEQDGARFRLIAGEVMGHRSAVPVHSPLYLLEVSTTQGATIRIGEHLFGESGLYILEGAVIDDGVEHGPRQLLVAKDSGQCSFHLSPGSTVYLFGGEPFPEERFIYWNFVATSPERLEAAKQRWKDRAFPMIEGEHDLVPLPGTGW
ncbi:MAG TPA: pirin-like C-terminal cupin domain-containing protein, partial [Flavobacteriales bacterium]|nr:pirin-like C-terminal cupin domain-containing protein [Flavobacteriales bacterium]